MNGFSGQHTKNVVSSFEPRGIDQAVLIRKSYRSRGQYIRLLPCCPTLSLALHVSLLASTNYTVSNLTPFCAINTQIS